MRTFTINGNVYSATPFDFNFICDLEEKGISLDEIATHPMSFVRTYFAICTHMSEKEAGVELEQHIINGGTFDEIMNIVSAEMDESGFFRSINKEQEKATTKSKKQG